jgi:hypothetical protein
LLRRALCSGDDEKLLAAAVERANRELAAHRREILTGGEWVEIWPAGREHLRVEQLAALVSGTPERSFVLLRDGDRRPVAVRSGRIDAVA